MNKAAVAFIGYQPDLDPTTPGILTECVNFVPYVNGFGPPPGEATSGLSPLAAACQGGAWLRKLDDTSRVIAGTQTKLYEASSTSWSDVSKGSGYSGGAESRWRFCQFGNYSIATNKADAVQQSQSGAFADLGTNCPKASICETVAGFVMLFDYNDGVNDYPDGWYCSPYQNPTGDWTASVSTQAANGRLLDTPGPIRAGRRLGKEIVAYKEKSMYMGFNDGPPVVWRWQLIPGEVGAVSQEAVVEVIINNVPAHIFAGVDDFYLFDGSRPVSVGAGVRNWWNENVSATYRYRTKTLHDRVNNTVYFLYPESDGTISNGLAFNYKKMQWGKAYFGTIEAALEYVTSGVTYHDLGSLYSTYQDLPTDIAYDSPYWTASTPVPAFFNSSHTLKLLSGTLNSTYGMTLGFWGSDDGFITLDRIRLRQVGSSGFSGTSATVSYGNSIPGATNSVSAVYNQGQNKFDLLKSAKWFKAEFTLFGDSRITGIDYYYEEDGEE